MVCGGRRTFLGCKRGFNYARCISTLMAGTVRIVFGVLFVLGGAFLVFTIIGILVGIVAIILGVVLLASGTSAESDARRFEFQQQQANWMMQQQYQMATMQANRPVYSVMPPPPPTPPPLAAIPSGGPAQVLPAERYCPVCGAGNARISAFCHKCGKPLPPPP